MRELYERDDRVHYVSGRGAVVGWKEREGCDLYFCERPATKTEVLDAIASGKFVNHSEVPTEQVIAEMKARFA